MSMQGDQESNATQVNLDAAEEIARQLRLRDLGGIVVIDFIDMKKAENRKAVFDKMKELLKRDKATTHVLSLSKFNLMQITRQRVRPQVEIKTKETCPSCNGTGKVESTLLLEDKINKDVEYLINNDKKFTLTTHPILHSHLTKGLISPRNRWLLDYKKWVKVNPDDSLQLTEYQFIDQEGGKIVLN
jgi:ribonuclease G